MLMLALGLAALAVPLANAGEGEDVDRELQRARQFDRFQVFYDGRRHAGLSLAHIDTRRDFGRRNWSFLYGECPPPSCTYPLEIQNWSICNRYPAVYPGDVETEPYRGARAGWVPTANSYEVYTGRTAIVIFANRHRDFREAASQLQDVRSEHRTKRFKPPVRGALTGDLPCQK
jgi:hypothetical protein